MKPYHHPRFILYHALTVGLGIAFAAGLLLAVAGFVGLVPPAQAQQQVSPPPVQSMRSTTRTGKVAGSSPAERTNKIPAFAGKTRAHVPLFRRLTRLRSKLVQAASTKNLPL